MNVNNSPSTPIKRSEETSQTNQTSKKAQGGTTSKAEFAGLAREGKPSIIFTNQANPSSALINANFSNMSQIIKKALVSLFDSSLHNSKIKEVK